MPLPTPNGGESQDDFMGRCMSDLAGEFPEQDQRAAVCMRQWNGEKAGGEKAGAAKPPACKAALPFEVKEADEESRTFTGLAAAWSIDLGSDRIVRGAFKRTLSDWRGRGRALPLIDSHNYGSARAVVGKMLTGRETADGLEGTWQVIDGPDGDEIYRRIKGGYVDGLSIGYDPTDYAFEEKDGRRIRVLKQIDLLEVSVVPFPMNQDARVLAVKSAEGALADVFRQIDAAEQKLAALRTELGALQPPAPTGDAGAGSAPPPASPPPRDRGAVLRDLMLRQLSQ